MAYGGRVGHTQKRSSEGCEEKRKFILYVEHCTHMGVWEYDMGLSRVQGTGYRVHTQAQVQAQAQAQAQVHFCDPDVVPIFLDQLDTNLNTLLWP